jgi:hypothetical protein
VHLEGTKILLPSLTGALGRDAPEAIYATMILSELFAYGDSIYKGTSHSFTLNF